MEWALVTYAAMQILVIGIVLIIVSGLVKRYFSNKNLQMMKEYVNTESITLMEKLMDMSMKKTREMIMMSSYEEDEEE